MILLSAGQFAYGTADVYATVAQMTVPEQQPINVSESVWLVQNAWDLYLNWPSNSAQLVTYVWETDAITGQDHPILPSFSAELVDAAGRVQKAYSGLLNETSLDWMTQHLATLASVTVEWTLQTLDLTDLMGPIPNIWTFSLVLDYLESPGANAKLLSYQYYLPVSDVLNYSSHVYFYLICNLVILLLNSAAALTCWWSLYHSLKFYRAVRDAFIDGQLPDVVGEQKPEAAWKALPPSVRLRFLHLWTVVALVGSLCNIFAGAFGLALVLGLGSVFLAFAVRMALGIGALLNCIALMQYLEYSKRFFTLIGTIRFAAANILAFLCAASPVFFGFALLAVTLFSSSTDYFADFDSASVTLFGMGIGDSLMSVFDDGIDAYRWSPIYQVFVFLYTLFFITAFMNLFILIIEQGFKTAKASVGADKEQPVDIRQLMVLAGSINMDELADSSADKKRQKSILAPEDDADENQDRDDEDLPEAATTKLLDKTTASRGEYTKALRARLVVGPKKREIV
jgi:hypothetical protein